MGLFDTFVPMPPRPVCPVCGGEMDRPHAKPGALVKPHHRYDQAMDPSVGNPCPGSGRLTVMPD